MNETCCLIAPGVIRSGNTALNTTQPLLEAGHVSECLWVFTLLLSTEETALTDSSGHQRGGWAPDAALLQLSLDLKWVTAQLSCEEHCCLCQTPKLQRWLTLDLCASSHLKWPWFVLNLSKFLPPGRNCAVASSVCTECPKRKCVMIEQGNAPEELGHWRLVKGVCVFYGCVHARLQMCFSFFVHQCWSFAPNSETYKADYLGQCCA